jgi:aminopeptidase N
MLRSKVWGAVWDQVRDGRMPPGRFAALLLRELPAERDEQIVPSLTGRLERTIRAYLPDSTVANVRAEAEGVLWAMASDAARPFGIRRPALDAYVALAETRAARDRLVAVLGADSAAGEPVRDPLRWSIVDRLVVVDDARADSLLARQARRDTTADGRRRAFTAGAARPRASVKADYFQRYFADASLNEEWASGSLNGFNAIEHNALTRPFLRPALDSLPFIQKNRRIFYLGSWLGSFLGGQRSAAAAEIVHQWLTDHPTLALDLRQKVLQTADELDRTARIRTATGAR